MVGFQVGIIVSALIAAGVGTYLLFGESKKKTPREQEPARVHVETKIIPAGTLMEDGTLPE